MGSATKAAAKPYVDCKVQITYVGTIMGMDGCDGMREASGVDGVGGTDEVSAAGGGIGGAMGCWSCTPPPLLDGMNIGTPGGGGWGAAATPSVASAGLTSSPAASTVLPLYWSGPLAGGGPT